MKITLENQAILTRLQKKNATYKIERWESDFAKHNKYKLLISEEPYEFGKG